MAAGTRLQAHVDELAKRNIELPAKVQAATQAVFARTQALPRVPGSDASMNDVDHGVDRCISALDNQLEEMSRAFEHEHILPLTTVEFARQTAAERLRVALFPAGTAFLRHPYAKQWATMRAIVSALDEPANLAAITQLGLPRSRPTSSLVCALWRAARHHLGPALGRRRPCPRRLARGLGHPGGASALPSISSATSSTSPPESFCSRSTTSKPPRNAATSSARAARSPPARQGFS